MPLSALGLLVVAGAMHAGWNLLVKRARQRQIFTWLSLVAGTIGFLPPLVFGAAPLPPSAWPFIVASGIVEALYFFALTRAYGLGDFSLVYPLARGAAPALLAFWATLFLGERLRPAGLVGLAIVCGGLLTVSGGRRALRASPRAIGAALLVALCISVYSAIDGAAVRTLPPIPYTVAVLGFSALCCAPFVLWRYRVAPIAAEWRGNWPRIVVAGVLNLATYMLVLAAYSRAAVAYAGAIREISIIFAALIGWRWLGEAFGRAHARGGADLRRDRRHRRVRVRTQNGLARCRASARPPA
jgi:drug/metabolite transporter (DMT)-like permease